MKTRSTLRSFLLLAAAAHLVGSTAMAQANLTWDANGATAGQTNGAGAWLGADQWWDGVANATWTSGDNATFGGPATAAGAVTLASPTTVNTLTFNPAYTGTYTLGTAGQAITLNAGITKNASSAAVSIVSPITLGAAQTWTNNSTSALTTANGTNLINNGGFDLTVDGTGSFNFGVINNTAASLTGSGALIKNGSGRLNVGGVNGPGFSGAVTINGGILQAHNDANVLGTGNLTLNGGVLSFYWGVNYTRALGTGTSEVQILGGESGFAGAGTTGPTINLGATVTWGSAFFNPSKFVLGDAGTGNIAITTFSSAIVLDGATRTIVVPKGTSAAGNRSTISGLVSNGTGTSGLTKEGGGYLLLSNNSSGWNGNTTVSEGLLDMGGINLANVGGGSGRNISVAAGTSIRFNALSNAILNRIVETSDEFTVMSGTTANDFDFSSSTGANLPNAFLGNYASNGAKMTYTGILTPAADNYRLGSPSSSGLLGMTQIMGGTQGLIVGGSRVNLVAANTFTGQTVIRSGAKLTIGNNLALQNSALNVGSSGGNFALAAGTNAGKITGESAAPSPTFGGLIGSRNLISVFTNSAGNNETNLTASAVTGFTLNVSTGNTHTYSGAIGGFGTGATGSTGGNSTLAKTGEGTQILTGSHTYTGATTISGGTLDLGTTGSIASSTALILGPAGTLKTSDQTADYVVPATQPITFGIDSTGSGSSGKIVADELDITSATATFDIPVALDDAVYVLATYTPTKLTGPFLSVPAAPSGYTLEYAHEGNKIALVSTGGTPFTNWASASGLDGTAGKENGPADDPDKDGKNNLQEFAFNGDPLDPSDNGMTASLIQDASAPAGDELTLVIAARNGATFSGSGSPTVQTATVDGVTYTIEGSVDLVTLPGSAVSQVSGPSNTAPAGSGLTADLTSAGWKYHVFKLDASEGLPNKGFLRAKVSE